MRTPFWSISFRSYEFLLTIERTPSARTGRRSDKHLSFLHLISTQSSCQKASTFSPKLGQYCPTHPPDNRGRHLLQMPQQGSFSSCISPGSSLGKSMTGKLVFNFTLMSMYLTSSLPRVPNNNENYTVTFTRITVHKRYSTLAIWRGRTTEITGPRCSKTTRISSEFWRETNEGIKYRCKRDSCRRHSPHVACNLSFTHALALKIKLLTSNLP